MKVKVTPAIKELCLQCAADQTLSKELRDHAVAATASDSIPWQDLKALASAAAKRSNGNPPLLHQLCQGGGILLPQPPPKPGKPPELQAHLESLQRKLDQAQYDRMVWEVTKEERAAAAAAEGGLHTYKAQMSFGMHVLAMMAAFYLFGHFAGRSITSNPVYHPAVGLIFMFFAMLMETVLYIIRNTRSVGAPLREESLDKDAQQATAGHMPVTHQRGPQRQAKSTIAGGTGHRNPRDAAIPKPSSLFFEPKKNR